MFRLTGKTMTFEGVELHEIQCENSESPGWVEHPEYIASDAQITFGAKILGITRIDGTCNVTGASTVIRNSVLKNKTRIYYSKINSSELSNCDVEDCNILGDVYMSNCYFTDSEVGNCRIYDSNADNSIIILKDYGPLNGVCLEKALVLEPTDAISISNFAYPVTFMRRTDVLMIGCQCHSVDWWLNALIRELANRHGVDYSKALYMFKCLRPFILEMRITNETT